MASADLSTFWYEDNPPGLRCLVCQGSFTNTADEALIRTFNLRNGRSAGQSKCSKTVETPSGHIVALFDRHLACLKKTGISVVAVSHVWDPNVSATQQRGRHSPEHAEAVAVAINTPIQVVQGFDESDEEGYWEFWHDYYSVPQWTGELKSKILLVIHNIFRYADITVVHLDDVSPSVVESLYHGATARERLDGMTCVTYAKWFSRMWTAMELARSGRVRTMTSDYSLAHAKDDPVFIKRVHQVFYEELRHYPTLVDFLGASGLGACIGPLGLGPLLELKELGRTNFAHAFVMLSFRGCRDEMDFLHAFRGIVNGATERALETEFWKELWRTARECLLLADFSPLLITPEDPRNHSDPTWFLNMTYHDYYTWELGDEEQPPLLTRDIQVDATHNTVTAQFERIGTVALLYPLGRGFSSESILESFATCAILALRFTGPDIENFVSTLGTRLYGEEAEFIMTHLTEGGHLEKLQAILTRRYNETQTVRWEVEGGDGAEWLADAMSLSRLARGFSESRLGLVAARYGTMHCAPHNYVVGITCTACHETFLYRMGGFVSAAKLRRARAFRIPGLKYRMSLGNGMAFLEADGRVIGRMLWATPACECGGIEKLTIKMPQFVFPRRAGAGVMSEPMFRTGVSR
ncbi:hypothetical protein CSOJ01_04226 [Colletotrichum sojae]|uniref:Uncharacterized protein n=1 Tax=Colletotrichum sojae TaxID=2175907 RepID=A0A8H6MYY0_9PEZI|nr:hypothetical protein CSOJ01_04226 [Colletotrichum sojae]